MVVPTKGAVYDNPSLQELSPPTDLQFPMFITIALTGIVAVLGFGGLVVFALFLVQSYYRARQARLDDIEASASFASRDAFLLLTGELKETDLLSPLPTKAMTLPTVPKAIFDPHRHATAHSLIQSPGRTPSHPAFGPAVSAPIKSKEVARPAPVHVKNAAPVPPDPLHAPVIAEAPALALIPSRKAVVLSTVEAVQTPIANTQPTAKSIASLPSFDDIVAHVFQSNVVHVADHSVAITNPFAHDCADSYECDSYLPEESVASFAHYFEDSFFDKEPAEASGSSSVSTPETSPECSPLPSPVKPAAFKPLVPKSVVALDAKRETTMAVSPARDIKQNVATITHGTLDIDGLDKDELRRLKPWTYPKKVPRKRGNTRPTPLPPSPLGRVAFFDPSSTSTADGNRSASVVNASPSPALTKSRSNLYTDPFKHDYKLTSPSVPKCNTPECNTPAADLMAIFRKPVDAGALAVLVASTVAIASAGTTTAMGLIPQIKAEGAATSFSVPENAHSKDEVVDVAEPAQAHDYVGEVGIVNGGTEVHEVENEEVERRGTFIANLGAPTHANSAVIFPADKNAENQHGLPCLVVRKDTHPYNKTPEIPGQRKGDRWETRIMPRFGGAADGHRSTRPEPQFSELAPIIEDEDEGPGSAFSSCSTISSLASDADTDTSADDLPDSSSDTAPTVNTDADTPSPRAQRREAVIMAQKRVLTANKIAPPPNSKPRRNVEEQVPEVSFPTITPSTPKTTVRKISRDPFSSNAKPLKSILKTTSAPPATARRSSIGAALSSTTTNWGKETVIRRRALSITAPATIKANATPKAKTKPRTGSPTVPRVSEGSKGCDRRHGVAGKENDHPSSSASRPAPSTISTATSTSMTASKGSAKPHDLSINTTKTTTRMLRRSVAPTQQASGWR